MTTTLPPGETAVGFALFSGDLPTEDTLVSTLSEAFGPDAGVTVERGIVCAQLGALSLYVSPMPGPVPDGEASANCHPLYGQNVDEIAAHRTHLLLAAAVVDGDGLPDDDRNARLAVQGGLGYAAASLLGLPGAVGYYTGGTTFHAGLYRESVLESLNGDEPPSAVLAPVWVRPEADGRYVAYTYGLAALGHPELQTPPLDADPNDLFWTLSMFADYVASGATLHAGQTIGRDENEKWAITAAPWVVDATVPAVTIEMAL